MWTNHNAPRYRVWIDNHYYHKWDSLINTLYSTKNKSIYDRWIKEVELWDHIQEIIGN